MENILLIEPGYKNKYPPIGLMKISTFHKEKRKDYVKFIKGIEDLEGQRWDRIYITTLFTFDFDIVVKTINHYKQYIEDPQKNIIIGGILASLLPEKLEEATGIKPFTGQVTCASMLGYEDQKGVNVDIEPLDYDILVDIDYKYSTGDSYIGYTSRGCPNKCTFCAVPTLEPQFNTTNNITRQITAINKKYGEKRHLMLMDNNILHSPYLKDIVEELKDLGFGRGQKTYKRPNYPKEIYKRIERKRKISEEAYRESIKKDIELFKEELKKILIKKNEVERLKDYIAELESQETLENEITFIKRNLDELDIFYENQRKSSKLVRYIDFNQGTDARLLTEEKMSSLSQIDIRPYRIAFDDIRLKDIYTKAMKIAASFGVRNFSNYILFNYKDTPEEFWERLKLNIDLAKEIKAVGLFSFPMKYVPIEKTDRAFTGEHWDKKSISNIYAILNAKKGIVPKGESYFNNAFGKTKEEFQRLLYYPRDFIIFREYFRSLGFTKRWEDLFDSLNEEERELLKKYQIGEDIFSENKKLLELFKLEKITKNRLDKLRVIMKEKRIVRSKENLYKYARGFGNYKICNDKNIREYIEKINSKNQN